jgi:phage shock protein A
MQVDDELARMKANMLPPSDNGKQLNPGSSSAAVDDELEKMRREMNK